MKKLKDFLSKSWKAIKKATHEGMIIQGQNLMMMSNAYQGKPSWTIG